MVEFNFREILATKPGYKKKGTRWLADKFNVSEDLVRETKSSFLSKDTTISNKDKILLFDIETSILKGYFFNIWNTNIQGDAIEKDWFVLSWAAKWLDGNEVFGTCVTSNEASNKDDFRVVSELWKLFDEANIIIGHNSKKFDHKKVNARFLIHGLFPPSPYKIIDTLKEAKKNFAFTKNSLDYLNKSLDLTRKLDNDGLELWIKATEGDATALRQMFTYNKQDVIALEDLYLTLRPWISGHPNVNKDYSTYKCPNCGSISLTPIGIKKDTASKYTIYRCECGAISKSNTAIKEDKSFKLNSI